MLRAFIFSVLFLSSAIYGEIKTICSIQEVEQQATAPLSSRDWFVFDIDYTLTMPATVVLQKDGIRTEKKRFSKEQERFTEEERDFLPSLICSYPSKVLTEPVVLDVIDKLRAGGATVFGFTMADTSVIPTVGELPSWRHQELTSLGITLSQSCSSPLPKRRVEFSQFLPYRGTYPVYEHGMLYCNAIPSKGEVFDALLDVVNELPQRVIFIDDTLENLESMEQALAKRQIPFLGLYYKPLAKEEVVVSNEEWEAVWQVIHQRMQERNKPTGIVHSSHVAAIEWAIDTAPDGSLIIFGVGNVLQKRTDVVLNQAYRLIKTEAPLKGPVLIEFLAQQERMPTKIVFVDDLQTQCESVAAAAERLGIPCFCVCYTKVAEEVVSALDTAIIDDQLKTLIKNLKREE